MKAISKIVNREFMQPELLICKQNSIVLALRGGYAAPQTVASVLLIE